MDELERVRAELAACQVALATERETLALSAKAVYYLVTRLVASETELTRLRDQISGMFSRMGK